MPRLPPVDRTLLALGLLVLASTAARFLLSRGLDAPWIASDEHLYGLLGRSLASGDGLTLLGEPVPFYSVLYPLLLAAPLSLGDAESGVMAAQALQAFVMSATAVPVFLWARRVAAGRWGLVAAGLTVLIPGLGYSGLLMSETLYYLTATVAVWTLAASLERPTLLRQTLLVAAIAVAIATRLQALGLLAVVLMAVVLLAVAERSRRPVRAFVPTLAALGALAGIWVATRVVAGDAGELLGAYATLSEASEYTFGDVAQSIAWQAGATALLTLGVPLVGLGVLSWTTLRAEEADAAVRALVVVAVSYLVVTVVEVSAFASRFVEHVTERQLLSVAPPVFVAFVVWLQRGAPRPQPVTSIVAFGVATFALLLPLDRVATPNAAADSLSTIPLDRLREQVGQAWLELVYAGSAAALLLLAVLLPRRLAPALAGVVAVALAAGSVVASLEISERSQIERVSVFAGAPVDWVDAEGARDATLLLTGERLWPSAWHHLFWNDSVTRFVRLPNAQSPGVIPQERVRVEASGDVVGRGGAVVTARELVAPVSWLVAGERLADLPASVDQAGLTLWRVDGPVVVSQHIAGLRPNGDLYTGESATITVYACGPGQLELTLLGKQALTTRVLVGDTVAAERAVPAGKVWRPNVPAPPSADGTGVCVYRVISDGLVGSTRIEFVRR